MEEGVEAETCPLEEVGACAGGGGGADTHRLLASITLVLRGSGASRLGWGSLSYPPGKHRG